MSDPASAILDLATAVPEAPESPAETPSIDTPEIESPEATDTVVDSPEVETTETPGEQSGESQSETAPKAPTAQDLKAALKTFRESHPEHTQAAKLLNDGYYRAEAYKSVFPTVEDARVTKAQLETIGGLEGLANMQQTLASVDETDALLDSGNPEVLDRVIEDSPEGFKKLAPHYLAKLQKLDPEGYGKTVQPHLVRALIDANLPNVLGALHNLVKDKPEAQSVVKNIMDWFEAQKSQAERTASDTISPEREELAKEREALNKERRTELDNKIGSEVGTHLRQELGSRLKPFAATLNTLAPAMRMAVAREAIQELTRALSADKAYKLQVEAMMSARKPDVSKIVAFNKAKVTALADQVIAKVVKNFQLKPGQAPVVKKAAKGPVKQSTAANTAVVKLSKQPSIDDIDWEHPGAKQGFLRHKAYMKNGAYKGRYVEWQ